MKRTAKHLILGSILISTIASSTNLIGQNDTTAQTMRAVEEQTNPIKAYNILFTGVLLKTPSKNRVLYVPNVFELFPANTVEGFVANPQLKYTQNLENGRFYSLTPNVRYGFGNERLHAQLKSTFYLNPAKQHVFSLAGGRAIEQLFEGSTLTAFNNTLQTFGYSENFLKVYERTYLEIGHAVAPLNNFWLVTHASWNSRTPLRNLNRFDAEDGFIPNNPENIELANTTFERHQALIVDVQLRWQVGHELVKKKGQLVSEGKYPSITVSYTNAVEGVLGGDVSYQKLGLGIEDDYKAGKTRGSWLVEGGDFLTNDRLTFLDFFHFKGQQTLFGSFDNGQFQLLDFYLNSTANYYLQAHYEHRFPALTKRKKFQLKPVMGGHYLYTEAGGHYMEFGGGFDKVLGNWRIHFYNSWRGGSNERTGIRVGWNFD